MSDHHDYLRDAMRVAVPVEDSTKVAERRERLVSTIELEIAATPSRLRREDTRSRALAAGRWGLAAAVLLGTLAGGMFLQAHNESDVLALEHRNELSGDSSPAELGAVDFRSAKAGSSVSTRSGEQENLRLPGDTQVLVAEASGLHVVEADELRQVLRLERGAVDLSVVPSRAEKARLVSVLTPHAAVEVKGTKFSVEVREEGAASSTQVSVRKGSVLVRHSSGEIVLSAGETWTSSVPLEQQGADSSEHRREREVSRHSRSDAKTHRSIAMRERAMASRKAELASTLAEQNRLFEAALASSERGDRGAALRKLDVFLAKYPRSPLRAAALKKREALKSSLR